jgi:hypothetical protein
MELGLIPIGVHCDEPGAPEGEYEGVSFMAFVNFVPRIGERLVLQDGNTCEVTRVYHKVVSLPGSGMISLMPNVAAVRISPGE